MTDLGLQDAIICELELFLNDVDRRMLWASGLEKINLYSQELPIKNSGNGLRDDDGDFNDQWNYICVVIDDEDLEDDEWEIMVHFAIGIKDTDKTCQGHRNLANLMNEIWLYFVKKGIINASYQLNDQKAHKRFDKNMEYPYYRSDLITYWSLINPKMEGLEELI